MESVLKHHGILGMRWGIRRYQNEDGSLTALGRKRRGIGKKKGGSPPPNAPNNPQNNSGQNQNQARITVTSKQARKRTDISNLSNEELQARIQRIQLENQYKQLTQREASEGEKFAREVIGTSLKGVATKKLTAFLNNRLNKLEDKIMGRDKEEPDPRFTEFGKRMADKTVKAEPYLWKMAMDVGSKAMGEYAFKYGTASSSSSPTMDAGSDFVKSLFGTSTSTLALPSGAADGFDMYAKTRGW